MDIRCQCGCGTLTKKGNKYILNHHKYRTGEESNRWSGGRGMSASGYVFVYVGEGNHPRTRKHWPYVFEHVLIMEKHLGRYLDGNVEDVHHINGDKINNRLENLQVLTKYQHGKLSRPLIDMSNRLCSECGSNITGLHNGRPHWYRIPNELFVCNRCYMKKYNLTYSIRMRV